MPSPILGSLAVNDCKKKCKYSLSNPRAKMPNLYRWHGAIRLGPTSAATEARVGSHRSL